MYFVDTPVLNDAERRATDELAEVIASRQFADWRELRFEPFTNPQVGKKLAELAMQVRDALFRVQATKKAPAKLDAVSIVPTNTPTTDKGSEQPTEGPTTMREPPTVMVDSMY